MGRLLPALVSAALVLAVLAAVVLHIGSLFGGEKGAKASTAATTAPSTTTMEVASAETSPASAPNTSNIYIVVLGSLACPHCRAQKSFFEREMPGKAYFCSVDRRDSTCVRAFSTLFTAGITGGIPTMVVCDNSTGTVKAIVVGELESPDAWARLFKLNTNGTIPVYMGLKNSYKPEGYLKPRNGVEALHKLYQLLCVETLRDSFRVG